MGEIIEAVKRAIRDSGESRYALAKRSGVEQSILSRLMAGTAGMSVKNLERLADALDLELTLKPKRQRSK